MFPNDSQKQTAHAYAKEKDLTSIESYGLERAAHFVDGTEHDHTWVRKGQEVRTASITQDNTGTWVIAGLKDLALLKSSGSEFTGFLQDPYTVLEPTDDRVLATALVAQWRFVGTDVDWESVYAGIKATLVKQVATVHSLALQQHTCSRSVRRSWRSFRVLPRSASLAPNKHHFDYALERFGVENNNRSPPTAVTTDPARSRSMSTVFVSRSIPRRAGGTPDR